jgi:hypothetical protein
MLALVARSTVVLVVHGAEHAASARNTPSAKRIAGRKPNASLADKKLQ